LTKYYVPSIYNIFLDIFPVPIKHKLITGSIWLSQTRLRYRCGTSEWRHPIRCTPIDT